MTYSRLCFLLTCAVSLLPAPAMATDALAKALVPHKALYDIELVATHSGSQIINISGKMAYEWKPDCDAWTTNHKFQLFYEYADSPGMKITSDFSTHESLDGKTFNFTSRRHRNGEMYQEIRGAADGSKAIFTMPEGVKYDLAAGTLYPMGHTLELIKHAKAGDKFYSAQVFDGSDEEGPIEINTFIGKKVTGETKSKDGKIDKSLLKGDAWNMRMAVFPAKDREEESDYEMDMVFHDNGIITDMLIEYDDFSVRQNLVSLERIKADGCVPAMDAPKKP